ncbi:hypothetical protein KUCAC02_025102 [Chaenocephalus aceratus]|nr:hypothetical protein KUCAC02_025102 [Chaenocephalus aceratus]
MIHKQGQLSDRERRYRSTTVHRIIRSMAIEDSEAIPQTPSKSLLLALMDLVDIQGGNELDSIAGIDKAGVKHALLAQRNYTGLYIPKKALLRADGKRVIPVVTQYSGKKHFVYCDRNRSMIGTYLVRIPTTGDLERRTYFLQEVLFVPGAQSLELLKRVTGDRFEFWDMALEMPTHPEALTPCFQLIQPVQLTSRSATVSNEKNTFDQACGETGFSDAEEIHPMCCVLDADSAESLKKKRESSVDCLTEDKVICDLKQFHYTNGDAPTVYFRRSSKLLYGQRMHLVPLVALRGPRQAEAPELHVSTTVRFCRAVTTRCVNGNGELVIGWEDTLNEVTRDTFISGSMMCQEIYQIALTAFIKRVNPNSWCDYIPKHLEPLVKDPVMVDAVELALKLVDGKIPNAFPVAELLYCPIEKVQEYLNRMNAYTSDTSVCRSVSKRRNGMVEEQIKTEWANVAETISGYVREKYGDRETDMVKKCNEVFRPQSPRNAVRAQKVWQALFKEDQRDTTAKGVKDISSNVKVAFFKLRTYTNMLKKANAPTLRSHRRSARRSARGSARTNPARVREKVSSTEHKDELPDESKDESCAGFGEKEHGLNYIVTPESVPIYTWIKNLPILLLSEPWLNEDDVRREAVCILLGLDKTLLGKKQGDMLSDWVIRNKSVVLILGKYGLRDRLSRALVDSLDSMSIDNLKRKVLTSLQAPGDHSKAKNPCTLKKGRSDKLGEAGSRIPNSYNGARSSRVRSPCRSRWSDLLTVADDRWCEEDEEYAGNDDDIEERGQDLADTQDYDEEQSVGQYSETGSFINDNTSEEYSSEEEREKVGEAAFCQQAKRARLANGSRNITDKPKYKRIAQVQRVPDSENSGSDEASPERNVKSTVSESGEGSESPGDTRGDRAEGVVLGKRKSNSVSSGSDDDLVNSRVKRVKRTKAKFSSRTSEDGSSASAEDSEDTDAQRPERGERRHREERRHRGKIGHRENSQRGARSKDRRPHENTRRGARDNRDVLRGRERSRVHRDRSPVEREERSPGENTRKDTRENTVARGSEGADSERSEEPREALDAQRVSSRPGSPSHESPGVSRPQVPKVRGEGVDAAAETYQATFPIAVTQRESSGHKGERDSHRGTLDESIDECRDPWESNVTFRARDDSDIEDLESNPVTQRPVTPGWSEQESDSHDYDCHF